MKKITSEAQLPSPIRSGGMNTTTTKLYRNMTPAERARIDAEEDHREARKANFVGADVALLDIQRSQFRVARREARKAGFIGDFTKACLATRRVKVGGTPDQWLDAAEKVLADTLHADNLCNDDYEGPDEPYDVVHGPRGW